MDIVGLQIKKPDGSIAKNADGTNKTVKKVYITSTVIQDASIGTAKIANLHAKVADIVKLTVYDAAVQGAIYSSGYSGIAKKGWALKQDGSAFFGSDVTFGGKLRIGRAGQANGVVLDNDGLKVYDSSGGLRVQIGRLTTTTTMVSTPSLSASAADSNNDTVLTFSGDYGAKIIIYAVYTSVYNAGKKDWEPTSVATRDGYVSSYNGSSWCGVPTGAQYEVSTTGTNQTTAKLPISKTYGVTFYAIGVNPGFLDSYVAVSNEVRGVTTV